MFHACTYKMRSARHRSYGNYIPLLRVTQAVCIKPALSLLLCQTIHSLPLSAASHARTNHCHWALSDRADAWRWGEITKTSVGVAFSLFSFRRKERKKKEPHATLLNVGATKKKNKTHGTTNDCWCSNFLVHSGTRSTIFPCKSI